MIRQRLYKKHQAFNVAHDELTQSSESFVDGFVAPRRYHHAPDKLEVFTDYRTYFLWSTELYASATKQTRSLGDILDGLNKATSHWYESKSKLKNFLGDLENLKLDLQDLHDDILEFQNCMLATDINP